MPSIALFCSKFTNEDAIKVKLATVLDLSIINDEDIIKDVCDKKLSSKIKLEQCLYSKTSVFNAYTLGTQCESSQVCHGRKAES
jgi:hypothetical protein